MVYCPIAAAGQCGLCDPFPISAHCRRCKNFSATLAASDACLQQNPRRAQNSRLQSRAEQVLLGPNRRLWRCSRRSAKLHMPGLRTCARLTANHLTGFAPAPRNLLRHLFDRCGSTEADWRRLSGRKHYASRRNRPANRPETLGRQVANHTVFGMRCRDQFARSQAGHCAFRAAAASGKGSAAVEVGYYFSGALDCPSGILSGWDQKGFASAAGLGTVRNPFLKAMGHLRRGLFSKFEVGYDCNAYPAPSSLRVPKTMPGHRWMETSPHCHAQSE